MCHALVLIGRSAGRVRRCCHRAVESHFSINIARIFENMQDKLILWFAQFCPMRLIFSNTIGLLYLYHGIADRIFPVSAAISLLVVSTDVIAPGRGFNKAPFFQESCVVYSHDVGLDNCFEQSNPVQLISLQFRTRQVFIQSNFIARKQIKLFYPITPAALLDVRSNSEIQSSIDCHAGKSAKLLTPIFGDIHGKFGFGKSIIKPFQVQYRRDQFD